MKTRHRTRHPGIYYRLDAQERRRYIVWYTDSLGKQRTEHMPLGSTEKDAVKRRAELMHRISRGEKVAPTKVTINELADEWLATKTELAPRTREGHVWAIEKHIKPQLGRFPVSSIREDEVARFIRHLRVEGKKASTINRILSPLSSMLAYAARRKGWIHSNPVKGLLPEEKPKNDQKKMRVLSSEQIEKLLGSTTTDQQKTLFATLLFTGMRISEALELEWTDVDLNGALLHIRESKTEAGTRTIVLTPFLANLLRRQKLRTPPLMKYVFHTGEKQLQRRNTLRQLERACVRAGFDPVTQHELRHTYASILIGQGADVTFVAAQLGHSDPGVTLKVYAKLFDPVARRQEMRDRLEVAFGGMV